MLTVTFAIIALTVFLIFISKALSAIDNFISKKLSKKQSDNVVEVNSNVYEDYLVYRRSIEVK